VDETKSIQRRYLRNILLHAYNHVPYYTELLSKYKIVNNKGIVNCDNFESIPVLTKDIIRENYDLLISRDPNIKKRKPHQNSSGGSTGEPVIFLQDKIYDDWDIANKLFFFTKLGKDIGEKEIKLWGSDRDIMEGTIGCRAKMQNFLYNRTLLNSFELTEEKLGEYINTIEAQKPVAIWAYCDSMFEVARHLNKRKKKMSYPKVVITTTGKLTDFMYKEIKNAFPYSCVIDQYGSREVGALAIQHTERGSFSYFPWSHNIEVVDELGRKVNSGEEGAVCVTALHNYSMPLIRYNIGDLAISSKNNYALEGITGRSTDHFIRSDGAKIHGEFFTHLMYQKKWVKRFKFLQRSYNDILVSIEPYKSVQKEDVDQISSSIKSVMGQDTKIDFSFVDKIQPTSSGKYRYTESKIA